MTCPYCGQGEIKKAIVKGTKEEIHICDECDTVWTSCERISDATGVIFEIYANAHNLKPYWTELDF